MTTESLEALEEEIQDKQTKVILNFYYLYVLKCIENKTSFLSGDEWYDKEFIINGKSN